MMGHRDMPQVLFTYLDAPFELVRPLLSPGMGSLMLIAE